MSWVRLDDHFADHPKVLAAGPGAAWLYVCGLCYSARHLTDGFLAFAQVKRLAEIRNPIGLADQLVAVGLWEKVDGGYVIHDYLNYNPSRAKVLQERANTAKRVQEHREKRGSNAVTDAVHAEMYGESTVPPVPHPVPIPHEVLDATASRPTLALVRSAPKPSQVPERQGKQRSIYGVLIRHFGEPAHRNDRTAYGRAAALFVEAGADEDETDAICSWARETWNVEPSPMPVANQISTIRRAMRSPRRGSKPAGRSVLAANGDAFLEALDQIPEGA